MNENTLQNGGNFRICTEHSFVFQILEKKKYSHNDESENKHVITGDFSRQLPEAESQDVNCSCHSYTVSLKPYQSSSNQS